MKRRRAGSPLYPSMGFATIFLVLFAGWIGISEAVLVQFDDCLKPAPGALHFKPYSVDAKFGEEEDGYPLMFEVHGNLTAPDQRIENLNSAGTALTTLRQRTNVLSYTPLVNNSAFCEKIVNGQCPILPNPDAGYNFVALPGFATSHNMSSSYAFSTFSTTFFIIPADSAVSQIGCISASVTPKLGTNLSQMLTFIPVAILAMTAIATIIAAIFNPNGSTDIFQWSSNYGRDPDMLRLVTPGFADCLQYIQFIVLTGSLSLNYPGFFQPVIANGAWSILLFNFSLVSEKTTPNPVDNVYFTSNSHGLGRLTELVGLGEPSDAWAGFMVVFAGIVGATIFSVAVVAGTRWLLKRVKLRESGDLRAKNVPFLGGLLVRVVYNYFLLPVLSLSAYQLVLTGSSPISLVVVSAIVFAVVVLVAAFLIFKISTYKPRSPLYDDLPTLLFYGPLYNTYDEVATLFCIVYLGISFMRAVAFGFVQPSGIAQLTLLAVAEIVFILTLNAFRPYSPKTSMNIYHIFISAIRLLSILFQIAFVPSLEVDESARGWIGYVILILHAVMLIFCFFMNTLQTLVEIAAKLAGIGERRDGSQRGGLARVFGKRQLSRRMNRSQALSPEHSAYHGANGTVMGEERKTSLMTGSRHGGSISGSSAILLANGGPGQQGQGYGVALTPSTEYATPIQETASVGRGHAHTNSGSTGYGPGTPRRISGPMYFDTNTGPPSAMQSASGSTPRLPPSGFGVALATLDSNGRPDQSNPYYRAPRKSRVRTQSGSLGGEWDTGGPSSPIRYNGPADYTTREGPEAFSTIQLGDMGEENARSGMTNPAFMAPGNTDSVGSDPRMVQDYSQRESDFYYGVRGPALSAQPSRKLRTGPADPTSTVASASGWLNKFSKWTKGKEKEKGFQVVRSARAPPPMRSAIEDGEGSEPAGRSMGAVAAGKLPRRSADSDDDQPESHARTRGIDVDSASDQDLTDSDYSDDDDGVGTPRPTSQLSPLPPVLPEIQGTGEFSLQSRMNSRKSAKSTKPTVPRKSSKRRSAHLSLPPDTYQPVSQQIAEQPARLYDPPLHENRSTSSTHRLPFTRPSGTHSHLDTAESVHDNDRNSGYSTNSSVLNSPAMMPIVADNDINTSRPASLGTVNRHKVSVANSDLRFGTESRAEYIDESERDLRL